MWGEQLSSSAAGREQDTGEPIQLIPPPYTPMIKSRLCRGNYGFRVNMPFIPGKHLVEDQFFDSLTGRDLAKDQMAWQLKRVSSLFICLPALHSTPGANEKPSSGR